MALKELGISLLGSAVSHFTDQLGTTIKEPKVGSILYTGLLADLMEHTGIYIGDGKIIELNNKGHICEITPSEFVNGGTGINIYVSSKNNQAVGSSLIAERAIKYEKEVSVKNYNILLDNCHMFTSACILGDLDNSNSFLWMVKDLAKQSLGADQWIVWEDPSRFNSHNRDIQSSEPTYTQHDLEQSQNLLQEYRNQSRTIWDDTKQLIEARQRLLKDAPHTWFFHSESREEKWQKKMDELDQIERVSERKHDDTLKQMKELEEQIKSIQVYLNKQHEKRT